jgi:hypothetical protein
MSLEKSVVHRPARAADRERFDALGEGAVVVRVLPDTLAELAETFSTAAARQAAFRAGSPTWLLAAGPVLDGPDAVLPFRLNRRDDRLDLEIRHTSVRASGVPLRRNIRWRPLVQVPLELPPGNYRVTITWRAVAALPDGEALDVPAVVLRIMVAVLPKA